MYLISNIENRINLRKATVANTGNTESKTHIRQIKKYDAESHYGEKKTTVFYP